MGLLDPQLDPMTLGLLQASAGLLAPRRQGGGLAGGIAGFGQGLLQGEELLRARAAQANRDRLTNAQIANFESDADYRKGLIAENQASVQRQAQADAAAQEQAMARLAARAEFADAYQRSGGQWSPQLAMLGMRAGIKGEDLERFAKGSDLGREKLTWQNGLGLDPFSGAARATAPDVNKPFFPSLVNGEIGAVPNKPVQDFQVSKARAGATNIGMPRIEVKMGDSVGSQVGPMLKDSTVATTGAVKMADAAERILDAVDKGGVIAGPTASMRLRGAQIASMLGIGGKDSVAQTRQVIRGLAESSVEARKELQGQGQVTENEAKAVQKALSGDIDDLTVDEIRDIARLNLRHAAIRAKQHQQYLSSMPESLNPARPFYNVQGMDRVLAIPPERYAIPAPAGANVAPDGKSAGGRIGQPSVDDLLKKYGGK
jgi:hypothetical protein